MEEANREADSISLIEEEKANDFYRKRVYEESLCHYRK